MECRRVLFRSGRRRVACASDVVGDPSPAERWAPLVNGWPGPTLVPVQPGHGDVPPPEGGNYGASDAAVFAARAMAEAGWSRDWPIVVGQGWGGEAAQPPALARRAAAPGLIDGRGGAWCDGD